MVDIHKKPGYDPVELFTDPRKKFMLPRIALKLLKKKLGFRTLLNVIPLDAQLVKGSHGAVDIDEKYYPILIDPSKKSENEQANKFIEPTSVFDIIKNHRMRNFLCFLLFPHPAIFKENIKKLIVGKTNESIFMILFLKIMII